MWTLEAGIALCREFNQQNSTFHSALTGSVLFQGHSEHDLDIILYPRDGSKYDIASAYTTLRQLGLTQKCSRHVVARVWHLKQSNDTKHVEIWLTQDNQRVDVFFLR